MLFKNLITSFLFLHILNLAVGMLYFLQIDFIKALEPSNSAANLFGPNTLMLCLLKKSTIPLTNGSSGPTITKSILYNFKILSNSLKFKKLNQCFSNLRCSCVSRNTNYIFR